MKRVYAKLPYRLVVVEWVDASRLNSSWMDLDAIPDAYLHRCVSVGYIVSENDVAKVIVPTFADIEHAANTHTYGGMLIPRSAILSERELR